MHAGRERQGSAMPDNPSMHGEAIVTHPQSLLAVFDADLMAVNIDRVGNGPLSACKVTDVRNPVTVTRTNRTGTGAGNAGELETIVVSKTISVSLDCT